MRDRGLAALLVWLALALAAGGCGDSRTSVLLSIVNGTGAPVPTEVQLNVFDGAGRRFPEARLPAQGALVPAKLPLLGTIVIYVSDPNAKLRLEAHGITGAMRVSQGILRVDTSAGQQSEATLTLAPGLLPDGDADLVPDGIDNCVKVANADQADRNSDGLGNACQQGIGHGDLGAMCAGAADCSSGFCAQGLCCQTPCNGTCQTCATTTTPGFCVDVSDGQDPKNECADQPPETCQQDGACDGHGACRKFQRAGTICKAPTCTAPSALTTAGTCDGAGVCKPGQTLSCDPYVCANGACKMACAGDGDCAVPRLCRQASCGRSPNGAACTDGTTCNSLLCVDGACCAAACAETCFSCNLPGAAGACTAIPVGQDAPADCPKEAASTCGRNGTCTAGSACAKYPDGEICVAPSCASSTQRTAQTCDGAGLCRMATVTSCGVYACTGLVCAATCAATTDCAAGYYCGAPTCLPQIVTGMACAANDQCLSGFCADGVCCATACAGTCKSCKLPTAGTCTDYAAGTDPDADCAQGLACTGAGACFATCTKDSPDCESGFYCTAAGACAPHKTGGAACGGGNECTSTFCTDGVCCAEVCTETCKSCNLAGSVGQCAFVPNGNRDPAGVNSCSAPRRCDGAGTCQ